MDPTRILRSHQDSISSIAPLNPGRARETTQAPRRALRTSLLTLRESSLRTTRNYLEFDNRATYATEDNIFRREQVRAWHIRPPANFVDGTVDEDNQRGLQYLVLRHGRDEPGSRASEAVSGERRMVK